MRATSLTTASLISYEKRLSQSPLVSPAKAKHSFEMTHASGCEWVLVIGGQPETQAGFRRDALAVVHERTVTIARRMVSLSVGDVSVASVTLIVRMVNDRLRGARWGSFSRELEEVAINVGSVRPEMVIATLRSAYRWRNRLPGWAMLLDVAREDFARRGLPADRLLRGLA
jgi:hypothetical protein